MIAAFLAATFVGRYLGPEAFADYSLAIAVLSISLAVGSFGLQNYAIGTFHKAHDDSSAIFSSIWLAKLLLSIVATSACLAIGFLVDDAAAHVSGLTAVLSVICLFQVTLVNEWYLQSIGNVRALVACYIGAAALFIIAIATTLLLEGKLIHVVLAYSAQYLLFSAAAFVLTRNLGLRFRFSAEAIKRACVTIVKCLPFGLNAIAVIGYMRLNQLMLSWLGTNTDVSMYSASLLFTEAWSILAVIMTASFMPLLSEAKRTSEADFDKTWRGMLALLSAIGVTTALLNAAFGPILIRILLGEEFKIAEAIIPFQGATLIPIFLGTAQGAWIALSGDYWIALKKSAAGLAVSLVINIVAIPSFGVWGAVASSIVAYFVSGIFINALLSRVVFRDQVRALNPLSLYRDIKWMLEK